MRAGDRLIDLGSGDGRIVLAAAQRGATAVGIEINANLVERSRAAARGMKLDERASFLTQDLFETDVAGADVVTLYLLPDVNARLAPKLLAALRPGARIVSHDYGLGDWLPDRTIVVDAPDKPVDAEKRSRIHFWRVPVHVDGVWSGETQGVRTEIDFRQAYQRVSGTLRFARREYRFAEQRIDGTALALCATSPGRAALDIVLRADEGRLVGTMTERLGKLRHLVLRRA